MRTNFRADLSSSLGITRIAAQFSTNYWVFTNAYASNEVDAFWNEPGQSNQITFEVFDAMDNDHRMCTGIRIEYKITKGTKRTDGFFWIAILERIKCDTRQGADNERAHQSHEYIEQEVTEE